MLQNRTLCAIIALRGNLVRIKYSRRVKCMKLYVTGVNRLSGTSKKTGKPYDFLDVACIGKRTEGFGVAAVSSLALDPILFKDYDDVDFPIICSVDFDQRGRVCDFDVVERSTDSVISALVKLFSEG